MPRVKNPPLTLETLEVSLEEVISEFGVSGYQDTFEKVLRAKPGTERHRELLCDLRVAADWVGIKAKSAQEAIDRYLDSLPDD